MRQTPLTRMLSEGSQKPDALSAFRIARAWLIAGRRIGMQELARELGVSRATLFRWVGSRDDLLSQVIWSLTAAALAQAERDVSGSVDGKRVAEVMERFCEQAIDSEFFGTFVHREPERALRLLTTKAQPFQGSMVSAVEQMLLREIDSGALEPPMGSHDLAYLIVRITESYIYSDLITGEAPDASKVGQALKALLY
jgi:AcrR family transcriptional regulator